MAGVSDEAETPSQVLTMNGTKESIPSAHWLGLATMLADDATAGTTLRLSCRHW